MTIGELARLTGLNIQTIRYYDRRGLLPPDERRTSGYRLYGAEAVRKVLFIKRAQELGFTLEEIHGLLRLRIRRGDQCAGVRRKAEVKLRDVRKKIDGLKNLARSLVVLLTACDNRTTTDSCPILKTLEVPEKADRRRRRTG